MRCPGCGSHLSFDDSTSVVECPQCHRHICRLGAVKETTKVVFFQGTFDGINAGHIRAIQAIAKLGRLVIGLNSDSLINWMIGHGDKSQPQLILPFVQRKEVFEGIKGVDEVIEVHEPSALRYLQQLKADIYVLTEEWAISQLEAIKWIEANGGQVVFSPRYSDIYCNSDIRRRIIEGAGE